MWIGRYVGRWALKGSESGQMNATGQTCQGDDGAVGADVDAVDELTVDQQLEDRLAYDRAGSEW